MENERQERMDLVPSAEAITTIPQPTAELIQKSFAQNTIRNRRHALQKFDEWLQGLTEKVSGHSLRIGTTVSLAKSSKSVDDPSPFDDA